MPVTVFMNEYIDIKRGIIAMQPRFLSPNGSIATYLDSHFTITSMLVEAGSRLQISSIPITTACTLYHRFFEEVDNQVVAHLDRKVS